MPVTSMDNYKAHDNLDTHKLLDKIILPRNHKRESSSNLSSSNGKKILEKSPLGALESPVKNDDEIYLEHIRA